MATGPLLPVVVPTLKTTFSAEPLLPLLGLQIKK